jgi:tetratricopeptide (TPR) repeat protein
MNAEQVRIRAGGQGQQDRFLPLDQVIAGLIKLMGENRVDEAAAVYSRCAVDIGYQLVNGIAGDESLQKAAANMLFRARDYAKAAMVCEALDEFEKAGQLYERADDTYMAAEMYARAGNHARAAAMYERGGNHAQAGDLYAQVGDKERAAECYRRVGKTYLAGRLFFEVRKIEKAVELLQRVEPGQDEHLEAVVLLASILVRSGYPQVAEKKLKSVVEGQGVDGRNVEVWYRLADLYARMGRVDEAKQVFTSVLDHDLAYKDAADRLKHLEAGGTEEALPEAEAVPIEADEVEEAGDEVVAMDGSLAHLKELPLFESLSLDDLRALASVAEARVFEPGEVIIEAGGKSVGLVIVTDGWVEVRRPEDDHVLATLSIGDHVGEMSLIDDAPTSARVVAGEASATCLVLAAGAVRELLDGRPSLALRFYQLMARTLCDRLRTTTARIAAS